MKMEQQSLLELKDCTDGESTNELSYSQRKHRPTCTERVLYIIVIGSIVLAFTIAAFFGYIYQANKVSWRSLELLPNSATFTSKNFSTEFTPPNLCLTPGCITAAAEILSNIDDSVEPCTDFYQFACGGWINRHPIPENRGMVSFFGISQDELNLQMKELLEKKLDGSEPYFIQILKNMYESCMDLKSIEEANSEPLGTVLKALGGWPVVERNNWNESAFDWIETLKSLRSFGCSHRMLLDLSVEVDHKNITTHRISLGQAELGVPDRTYLMHGLNDSSALAYFNLMIKAAKKLGADETTVERELLKSFQFEVALANNSLPREAFRNSSKTYNKYTVRKLQQLVPQVPWLKYFNSLLDEEIHEDEPLIVSDVDFIIKFGELISTTEKRVISNYVLWRVVFQSLSNLSAEWRNLLHEYSTAITGRNQQNPRWEECLFSLTGYLNTALSSYYVRNYFDEENKEAGMKLYRYIHKEFLENLEKIDWMEKETKKEAKAKVEAIKAYSGYPDELLNDTLIQELYTNLNITKDSFFHNTLRLKKWASDSEYALLRKPYLKSQWVQHSDAVLVNSFYRGVENSIEFLAGILRKGFFDKNRPHFMNFGAIGFVLAHELTHSLDDVGRQFDKDGNNVNWWDKTTEEKFWKKAQCIIDEFSSFTAKNGMKLNGVNTQGENIADNGGFKIAYKAYQSWIKDNGPDLKLPGLKYTPSQLFWISTCNITAICVSFEPFVSGLEYIFFPGGLTDSWGDTVGESLIAIALMYRCMTIWCGKFRPEALKLRILTGTHTPHNFRIIGGFSNLAEFSQEFNCSSDTQMNHNSKCTIW